MKETLSTYSALDSGKEDEFFDKFIEAHPEIADLSSEVLPPSTAFEKLATTAVNMARIDVLATGYANSTNQDGGEDLDPTD